MFQLAFKVKHKLEKYEIYAIIGWLDPVFRNLAHGEVYESILDKPGFEMKKRDSTHGNDVSRTPYIRP